MVTLPRPFYPWICIWACIWTRAWPGVHTCNVVCIRGRKFNNSVRIVQIPRSAKLLMSLISIALGIRVYFPVFRITPPCMRRVSMLLGERWREMRRERRGRWLLMVRERENDRPENSVSRQCCFRRSQRRDTIFECYVSSARTGAHKPYYNDK